MPGGHDTTIEVSNIMSFVLYTQILKQSVLKPASPGITLIQWVWKILKSDNFFQPTTSEITVRKNKHMYEPLITVFRRYGWQGKSNMCIP